MDQAEGLLRAYGGLHNALQQTFPKLPLSGTTNNLVLYSLYAKL